MRRILVGAWIAIAASAGANDATGGVIHATFLPLHSLFEPTGLSNGGALGVGNDYHGRGEL